ncbi:Esa1p-associated factor, partial [Quaeritorhiza haematococci]
EDEFIRRPEIKIIIPDSLKVQLVDDWENVTKNQKLVKLPREPTVNQILTNWKESMKKSHTRQSRNDDIIAEVVSGLKLYFDKALPNILLYRFERLQYVEIKKQHPEKSFSEIYGAEHLMRLFVQLPSLIAHTNMDQDAVNILRDYFVEFLKYVQKNHQELFVSEYETASPNYIAQQKMA